MTRYLLIAAVLAAGCEQLKSPERIHQLEDRVDKLSKDVEAMRGPGAKRAKTGAAAGSGSGERVASTEGEHGGGGAEGSAEPAGGGSDEHAASAEPASGDGAGEHGDKAGDKPGGKSEEAGDKAGGKDDEHGDKAGDKPGGKPGGKEDEAGDKAGGKDDEHGGKAGDKAGGKADERGDKPAGQDQGSAAPMDKAERALAELHDVVAKATRTAKPAASAADPPHWSYENTGPRQWSSLDPAWKACTSGKAQSPIDIVPRAGTASPIVFHYQATPATVVDNGHTLQVNLTPGSTIEIGKSVYQLVQFHFHAPSEHTIAGEHFPLELHLVHRDADGSYAVIAVMYDTGPESRPLGALWSRWPRKVRVEEPLRKVDPSELLPETRSVYRYTGSLTTPPCTEGVVWNVMRRAMTDSKAHLEVFTGHYPHSARDVQPLNDRRID